MHAYDFVGTVLGPWTLHMTIGQGRSGIVFLGQHSVTGQQVAVKVLTPGSPLPPGELAAFLDRFNRSVSSAAQLVHPHILPILEYGEQNGVAYVVTPYSVGGSLGDLMQREGRLPLPRVQDFLAQLGAALSYAHAQGVVHWNITPANILLTDEGHLELTDFGLGTLKGRDGTQTGGTLVYLAPEQILGGPIDVRADIYALGVLLYQMVTGMTPYQGETMMHLVRQLLQQPIPSPRLVNQELPAACERVLLRALAKRAHERYAQVQDLLGDFDAAIAAPEAVLPPQMETGTGPLGVADRSSTPLSMLSTTAELTGREIALSFPGTNQMLWTASSDDLSDGHASSVTHQEVSTPLQLRPLMTEALTDSAATRFARGLLTEEAETHEGNQTHAPQGIFLIHSIGEEAATKKRLAGRYASSRVMRQLPQTPLTSLLLTCTGAATTPAWRRVRARTIAWKSLFGKIGLILIVLLVSSLLAFLVKAPSNTGIRHILGPSGTSPILLADSLAQAHYSWPTQPSHTYAFRGAAYHLMDDGDTPVEAVLLTYPFHDAAITYMLTMQAESLAPGSAFGLLFRCSSQDERGRVQAFYAFEVTEGSGGEYRLLKYDARQLSARLAGVAAEWTILWQRTVGGEFRPGTHVSNTLTIVTQGPVFRLYVNGLLVGMLQDTTLSGGAVGMLVQGQQTDVAFWQLLVSRAGAVSAPFI